MKKIPENFEILPEPSPRVRLRSEKLLHVSFIQGEIAIFILYKINKFIKNQTGFVFDF
jgi:hypothetical protein